MNNVTGTRPSLSSHPPSELLTHCRCYYGWQRISVYSLNRCLFRWIRWPGACQAVAELTLDVLTFEILIMSILNLHVLPLDGGPSWEPSCVRTTPYGRSVCSLCPLHCQRLLLTRCAVCGHDTRGVDPQTETSCLVEPTASVCRTADAQSNSAAIS